MAQYYHVVVRDSGGDWKLVFEDLTERELRNLFVERWKAGQDILTRGRIFRHDEVSEVRICRTELPAGAARKARQDESYREIQEFNRNSNVVLISAGSGHKDYEIKDCSENVTGRFLLEAPGAAQGSRLRRLLYDPWVVRVVGGLIVAGLLTVAALLFAG